MVAPNSIPSPRGKQIKTDRIDAAHMAQFYATGLLTMVSVPKAQQEQDRDLMRWRTKSQELQGELRQHIHAFHSQHVYRHSPLQSRNLCE